MPIIRSVNGIVKMHPALPVSPRPPATQVTAAGRKDRSTGQERQTADYATHLAQQAYQQQAHQVSAPKRALLAQDLMASPVTWLPSDSTLLEDTDCDETHGDSPSPCYVGPRHVGRSE
jgi:hypothetical protein